MEGLGDSSSWERLVIDGKVQTRNAGTWAAQDAAPPTDDLAAALAGITDVTDVEAVTLDGQPSTICGPPSR